MANKLPFDDEQALEDSTVEETPQDDLILPDPSKVKALPYFDNDLSDLQPEGDQSLVGKEVGQSMAKASMAPPAEMTPPEAPVDPRLALLKQYGDLKKIQDSVKEKNNNLNYGLAGNQIAQAIASGYGGKVGDGSEAIKMMQDQNNQEIKSYHERVKDRMDVPDSDVAKFYRYKLAKQMKDADPKADISMLDGMSANEMEQYAKLTSKAGGGRGDLFFTQVMNPKTGKPEVVAVDRKSGDIVKSIGDKIFQDRIVKDPVTGQNMKYNQLNGAPETMLAPSQQGMAPIINANNSGEAKPSEETKKIVEEQKSSPTILNKVNPELYKKFNDQQKEFLSTVKENRDVATSATTLASKLKSGDNGEIDSGLLGGIQTQAAKMAGQKGVLTDQDLVKFAGAGGVAAKIDRIIDGSLFGQMSDDDIKFFKKFSEKMQASNAEDIKNRAQIMIKNVHNEAKDYIPGLKEENVAKWLNVDSAAPASQGTAGGKEAMMAKIQQGEAALKAEKNPSIRAKIEAKLQKLKSELGQ